MYVSVVSVMKTWVTGGYISDNSDILPRIRGKAHQIAESAGVAGTILRMAKEISGHIDRMVTPSHLIGIYVLSHHSPNRNAKKAKRLKLRIFRGPRSWVLKTLPLLSLQ
jgi:hypothetical protein